ncbi:MAG TPA: VOC family protein [Opitutales bacterium]|jgi:catechol 2,3-dioxygenase-like lactoylglutathione lyase family enzyme|nr:VOC family protein [Opitutales bacterium]
MQIREFAFVCYPVTDLPRARQFFEKILGLKPATTYGDNQVGGVEYEIGPHTLCIINMVPMLKPSPEGTSVVLELADFDAAIAELKAANVPFFVEPLHLLNCKMAIICDPDGSKICLHQRNPVQLPNVG